MDLNEMSIEQLRQTAKKMKITFGPNTGEDNLREKVENVLIQNKIRREEETRQKLQMEFKLKTEIAEIKEAATYAGIKLKYPESPTIEDVVKLRVKLGLEKKKPKPSPETIGIEASKKNIYKFTNVENVDVDVFLALGGKYVFHLWPRKKFVLPEYAVERWKEVCVIPAYKNQRDPIDGIMKSVRDKANESPRFIFEYIKEAPPGAKLGSLVE